MGMSDQIGYTPTEEDISAVVSWLEKNDPENAKPEFERQMLLKMRNEYREIGRFDEDLLHKLKRQVDEKTQN